MKEHFLKYLVCLLAFTVFAGAAQARDTEVVFATGEWLPFTSESLPDYGAATALISAICRAGGITPVFQFYPWKRAELKVARGEVFAAFPYAVTEERKITYDFSDILFYGVNVFVYFQRNLKGGPSLPYRTIDDLHGYRIGCISGSFLYPLLERAGLNYEPTTTVDQSIQKLVAGRIDFIVDNQDVIFDAVRRLYPDDIDQFKVLPEPLQKAPTALLVSRTYPRSKAILKKFNKGLTIIRENGEYDRILDKYHITR
ncbi:MAG: substrate-binding periplasmic protein [Desulforhopalus sp.]